MKIFFNKICYVFTVLILIPNALWSKNIQEQLQQGEVVLENRPVEVDKISYKTLGKEGNPWLVLVHGLGGNKNTWSVVAEKLSKNFQILMYDQRGHGSTTIDSDNYTSSTMARDLAELMNKLNIQKAHLVGHSMGGRTVLRFGATYPERTLSVTVEDMHAMGRTKILNDLTELSRKINPLYKPIFNSAEDFYRTYQPYMQWENPKSALMYGYIEKASGRFILNFKPHVNMLYSNQALQEDLTSALTKIKAPTTFFAAGDLNEAVLFGKGIDHILQNKPDAKIVQFDNAGHSIHWDTDKLFLQELKKSTDRSYKTSATCLSLFHD